MRARTSTRSGKSVTQKLNKRNKGHAAAENIGRAFTIAAPPATSRPGQCGRCDGYILEGMLDFYVKKMQKKKGKHGDAATAAICSRGGGVVVVLLDVS